MKRLHLFTAFVYVLAIVLGLLIAMGLSFSRLDAQEATPEATTAPLPPIVVEDGGTVIVEAPDTPLDTPIVSNEVVVALIAVVGFVAGIVVGIRKGAVPDQSVATQIESLQQNRATMELLERQLAAKDAITRMAFDTFAGFFKLIAPLTPLLSDNALSKFLEDLQKQGPPETPPGASPSTSSGNPTSTIYTTPHGYPPPSINITTDTSGTSTPAPGSLSQPKRD